MERCLLDTDTLSEIVKARNPSVQVHAREYLAEHGKFSFSLITRYEILRGLRAKTATRQISVFDEQCRVSDVAPLTDEIIQTAAEFYGRLYQRGELLADADLLIAATAIVNNLPLVTGNTRHFSRITELVVQSWHTSS